jgi:RNase H-like domain found in reverse transcriptase
VWHLIGFISKSLDKAERNYEIHDKELLSVIRGLEDFRHILEGATHPVEVLNDHRNLTYFQTAQNLNRRQARWALFLSRFNILLTHRAGKHSAKPDALSRRADHNTGEDDNMDEVLVRPELFAQNIHMLTTRTPFVGPEQKFIDQCRIEFESMGQLKNLHPNP